MKGFLSAYLVRSLRAALSRLEKPVGTATARTARRAWYQTRWNTPPAAVAVLSAVFLFLLMWPGAEQTGVQAVTLAILVMFVVGFLAFYIGRDHPTLARDGSAMMLLAVVSLLTLGLTLVVLVLDPGIRWVSPFMAPVALAPLLVALLLHIRLAVVMAFVISILFGVMNGFSLTTTVVGVAGGVTVVATGIRARTTSQVARASLLAGLAQAIFVFVLSVSRQWATMDIVVAIASAFASGLLVAMLGLGILPFLENVFSRTSNLRLLELSDVNHPLLRRMSLEAPGTYHHSLIVASLAEEAANAVGANGLLCRVGAYFHDIGKLMKAEYFIENQGAAKNPHDEVNPSLSRLVIISHVKEGIALAKVHKLDRVVVDLIPQHHGTSQIEYFYQKALRIEAKEEEEEQELISSEAYRYPGPRPQSKEAGIIMLADSVEAASRALEEPNHQRYKDLVYKIINKKLMDGQLDETPLTLRDLRTVADRFTAVLLSINHARIPYPESGKPDKQEFTPAS